MLDDIRELQNVEIDAMKLDTQGLELPILSSAEARVDRKDKIAWVCPACGAAWMSTTWLSAHKAAPTSTWISWSRSAAGATTRPMPV